MSSATLPAPALAHQAAWPPPGLPLAVRAFAERTDAPETALDQWAAGWWLSRPSPAPLRARQRQRFMAAVDAHGKGLAHWDDARLRQAARAAAAPALLHCDEATGALALALLREVARRQLGLLAHPPQLLAAWKLVCGRLIELDTGEGKTLTAGLAACLGGLAGVPTHVVTVNDYLAQRDAGNLAPLFGFFGLRVGVVHSGVAQGQRAAAYAADITYCTNKDLVFDYLRDRVNAGGVRSLAQWQVRSLHGLQRSPEALRLRGLHLAIVDEADSILIDEARTPLILSAARDKGEHAAAYTQMLEAAKGLQEGEHYRLLGRHKTVDFTDAGRNHLNDLADAQDATSQGQITQGLDFWRVAWAREHYMAQALRALQVLQRDHHYVVREGKVVIVDEFTGRLLPDRSWEQGLHQLVEAKEGCAITGLNVTLARLTYQGFFARYLRLSGMSGTLGEVARETAAVYRVRTERIEPNRPCQRIELPTLLLPDAGAQQAAVVAEVRACQAKGQPVLVGTRSVQASMALSSALAAQGIVHRVLNALQNADEAELIAAAGQRGAVTVATNMAGRGTDIPLAPEVVPLGGLHVVLTEWHESARIDRQLFGRCARQGDPGSCRAIVCMADEVIQLHAAGMAQWMRLRWPGGPPPWGVRLLRRTVQRTAERINASQRRATMAHDSQMRRQLAFSGSSE
jgi:preprotein translocase subunit SecA